MFRTLTPPRFAPFPTFARATWGLVFRLEVVGQETLTPAETPATFVIGPAAAKSWPAQLRLRSGETLAPALRASKA
jgi:hypothetical protein